MKTIRRAILAFLGIMIVPSLLLAAPTIPGVYGAIAPTLRTVAPTQLPRLLPGGLLYGATVPAPTANQLTIFQNQPQAIIDWSSFDIGANAWVYFNQKGNTSWVALNRIWDNSPSQIFGHLTADGKVYLINQNGILFGPGSQVNVHALVASSLNLQNSDFLPKEPSFLPCWTTMAKPTTSSSAPVQGTASTPAWYPTPAPSRRT